KTTFVTEPIRSRADDGVFARVTFQPESIPVRKRILARARCRKSGWLARIGRHSKTSPILPGSIDAIPSRHPQAGRGGFLAMDRVCTERFGDRCRADQGF